MLIASYNPQSTGDTMVLIMNPDVADQQVSIHDDVARIFDEKTNRTLGYNFLKASEILPEIVTENGQVNLTSEQVQKLNDYLTNHGFPGDVEFDDQPKFVVGYVESLEITLIQIICKLPQLTSVVIRNCRLLAGRRICAKILRLSLL